MRITKTFFVGATLTCAYIVVTWIKYGSAYNALDTASSNWNVANDAYKAADKDWTDANKKIDGANCSINKYTNFLDQLATYCNHPFTDNIAANLNKFYSIGITQKPDTRIVDSGIISSDINFSKYGTTFTGIGSSMQNGCGIYNYGMRVYQKEYLKHYAEMSRVSGADERHGTSTYASQAVVDLLIGNGVNSTRYELNPKDTNHEKIAEHVHELILKACSVLPDQINKPDYYQAIINATLPLIPDLNSRLTAATSHKDQLLKIVESTSQEHERQLFRAILIPCSAFLASIAYIAAAQSKNYEGYSMCDRDAFLNARDKLLAFGYSASKRMKEYKQNYSNKDEARGQLLKMV